MSVVSLTALKSYFETGDKPTQAEFENLIDTLGQFVDVLVPFKLELTNSQLRAGGEFDIEELPAPGAGYAWEYLSGSVKSTGMGAAFDGTPTITLITEGSRSQFTDDGNFLSVGTDYFATLERTTIVGNLGNSLIANTKGQVSIDAASSVGDGSIIVYGMARKITL